jgi:hypothetical protein
VEVPKPGGGHRLLTLLDRADEARYVAVVERVAGLVERSLGAQVLANRAVEGTALAPWRPAWRRLLRARAELSGRGRFVVHADVRRCYPSITSGTVARALDELGACEDDARAVVSLLDRFQETSVPGLPIGPDPSAVLANAVLASVDHTLRSEGFQHVRWVDDVWAAARDADHARRALDRLRGALRRLGLEVHEDKTEIIESGDAAEVFARGRASQRGL